MGLIFCCPSCGANLRVTAEIAPSVSCPSCGELIRVPRQAHPVESSSERSEIPPSALAAARTALRRLLLSLRLSTIAGCSAVAAFALRLAVGQPNPDSYPDWFPIAAILSAALWLSFALFACTFRMFGYTGFRPLAAILGIETWARTAAFGAGLTAVGVVAVVPWLIGRPFLHLSAEMISLVLIGLACGLIGMGIEFAILTVLHRILWETAGWQAANSTSRFTSHFVFSVVVGMGSVCLGVMATVLAFGGHERQPGAAPPPEVRWVGAIVLIALMSCAAWAIWRYARLLSTTFQALNQPEPQPPKVPHAAE
jgi:hypothetical protein